MALVLADRVRETTTTAGTGTITLLGAVPSCQSFAAVGNGNTTYYTIVAYSGTEWEVGIGTYTASGTTLSRDTVLSSSNSGSLVNFSAGTKDVFVDYPAGRAVYEDAAGNVDGYPITGGTINNTTIGATTPSTGVFTTLTATGQTNIGTGLARSIVATGSASGSPGMYATAGGFTFSGGGSSGITFYSNLFQQLQLNVAHTASAVNYVQVTGGATTKGVIQSAQGSDSNISYVTQSKGTGAINLAPGSSGVNISNGGTVTAVTVTASGASYNPSGPTVSITAPTTAGGVQAVLAVATMNTSGNPTVVSGGTGYTNGDTLTIAGTSATLTVTGISGGVITSVASANFLPVALASIPANPASVTGGTGSGATFNILWKPVTLSITNAGSGYVEQPTVSFSGGGGSGAAAYATVGSTPTLKSIHTELRFETSGGVGFEVQTYGAGATTSRFATFASASGNPVVLEPRGAATNIDTVLSSKGTGSNRFFTNSFTLGSGNEQLRVAHTASAVNYVQVTGAATGGRTIISTQGSDASPALDIVLKGTPTGPGFRIQNQGAAGTCFAVVTSTASVANHPRAEPSIAGSPVGFSAQGNDTNIDLALTPKGTGNVRFGTYTATVSSITGYIEIKDAGGTIRRLAVVA